MMVPYAGYDPEEGKRGYYPSKRELCGTGYRQRAYTMFRAGSDTHDIAHALDVTEARVLEWINIERSDHRGLPRPYEVFA